MTITSNVYIPCLPNTELSHTQQKLHKDELFTEYELDKNLTTSLSPR